MQYKVIAGAVFSDVHNKVYSPGEIVEHSCFSPGSIPDLVKGKFIEPLGEAPEAETEQPAKEVAPEPIAVEETPVKEELPAGNKQNKNKNGKK
jgi:hypothetical protein